MMTHGVSQMFLATLQIAGPLAVVLFLGVFFFGDASKDDELREPTPQGYDGGFPVPPMPDGGAVRGAAAGLTFETGRTVAVVEEDQTV